MQERDLENLERSIQDILSDARSITNMVNRTISQYQASMPKRAEQAMMEKKRQEMKLPEVYGDVKGFQTESILKIIFGGILEGIACSSILARFLIHMILGVGGVGGYVVLFLLAAASAWLILSGVRGNGRVRRFKKYLKALGSKTYCDFRDLGKAVGKPAAFVKDDVKYMIEKGWFLEGHTDHEETCLITTEETYSQYQATALQMEEIRKEQVREQQMKKNSEKAQEQSQVRLSPEVREVLRKGNAYLDQIRACNDAIPGEEISAKISRMEQIVHQIFQRAQEHPEIVPDLRRMMEYYLPTSIKLLQAYADMDAQAYQGANIQNSKKEIEQTIDTLTLAFEKLLDSVFKETAWDVASDISVLNTLLAQEGLTEDGLMGMH